MKTSGAFLVVVVICLSFLSASEAIGQPRSMKEFREEGEGVGEKGMISGRNAYELMRLRDPITERIPNGIARRELKFSSQLPSREQHYRSGKGSATPQSIDWVSRGPSNIGGRTPALGIDINNENIILAGSTSGGMWRSTDRGNSWVRTTPMDERPNIACLAQDTRAGKTNTWYCATGEVSYASAGWPPYYGDFVGNGLFKSSDNGQTWSILPSTVAEDSVNLTQPFNYVAKIAIDPSNESKDIVYAAVQGGIMRSSDGGTTWNMTLGSFPSGSSVTDVVVTSKGVVYAAMGEFSVTYETSTQYGVFRSVDGITWTDITPTGWQPNIYEVYIGIAPSNENVLYLSSDGIENGEYPNYFWKYTYESGDGAGTNGRWEDRSANFNQSGIEYAGYVKVKPDDENTIFLGRLNLWRSTDGLETPDNVQNLSIVNGEYVVHVDHEAMAFFPSDPAAMLIGCDGGVYFTPDNTAGEMDWTELNNNYLTSQFYTVAIDHSTSGNTIIIGGTQDNGTNFTGSDDAKQSWGFLFGGDGSTCAIASSRSSYYVSYQNGNTFREIVNDYGYVEDYGRIDPVGGTGYIWINPFALDPNNNNRMYLAGGKVLWRNSVLPSISLGSNNKTSIGWAKLAQTTLSSSSPFGEYAAISAVSVSTTPANRVYYGTNDGQLFRLDSAHLSNAKSTPIWIGKGFPARSFINCIAIDPEDGNKAVVVFSNYNVLSLFYTSNAGTSWTPISGNLEEHANGSGNGPSCRWVSILHVSNGTVYLCATSTGLYSTSQLNGASTVWTLEGKSSIGHSVIDMIDVRSPDGFVAVATHGHGIFSATITSVPSGVRERVVSEFSVHQNYPNPFSTTTTFTYDIAKKGFVTIKIFDVFGKEVSTILAAERFPGSYVQEWSTQHVPAGSYILRITCDGQSISKVIQVVD
jgi:hypothetical protein